MISVELSAGVAVGVCVDVDVGVWVTATGSKVAGAVTVGLANGSMGALCINAVTAETVSIGVIVGVSLFPETTIISEVGVVVAKPLSFHCWSAELPETFAKSSK